MSVADSDPGINFSYIFLSLIFCKGWNFGKVSLGMKIVSRTGPGIDELCMEDLGCAGSRPWSSALAVIPPSHPISFSFPPFLSCMTAYIIEQSGLLGDFWVHFMHFHVLFQGDKYKEQKVFSFSLNLVSFLNWSVMFYGLWTKSLDLKCSSLKLYVASLLLVTQGVM